MLLNLTDAPIGPITVLDVAVTRLVRIFLEVHIRLGTYWLKKKKKKGRGQKFGHMNSVFPFSFTTIYIKTMNEHR